MTPDQFKQARKDIGLSVNELADQLGISSRTVRRYEKGTWEVTRVCELAMLYLLTNN